VDEARPALGAGARLVEADVPRLADAEDLEVDPAEPPDVVLVAPAGLIYLVARDVARREVNVLPADVDVREQVLPHVPVVRVDAVRRHRVVLVQVERHHVLEGEPLVPVEADQLAVDADRRRSGGEAQHGALPRGLPLADQGRDALRDEAGDPLVVVHDDRPYALAARTRRDARRPATLVRIAGLGAGADVREDVGDRSGHAGARIRR
jgi:hypothetical protein